MRNTANRDLQVGATMSPRFRIRLTPDTTNNPIWNTHICAHGPLHGGRGKVDRQGSNFISSGGTEDFDGGESERLGALLILLFLYDAQEGFFEDLQ